MSYDGTFLVDPKNFDLVRLSVYADQIPAELNTCVFAFPFERWSSGGPAEEIAFRLK